MRLFPLAALLVACTLGCSRDNPRGPVTGKVTLDGRPVTAGRVTFASKDLSLSVSAELTPEGTFSIVDAPTGEVVVAIRTKDHATLPMPATKANKPAGGGSSDFTPNQAKNPLYVPVPARYEDPVTSGLTTTIPKSGQKFVFDIPLTR